MFKSTKNSISFILLFILFVFAGMLFAAADSLGVVGLQIDNLFEKFGLSESNAVALVSVLGAVFFRIFQIILQKLPTRWRWVNNRLTLGLINRILSWLFGKTTMVYNADVMATGRAKETAKEELRKTVMKHLSRNGGVLQAVNEALEKQK